MRFAFLFIVSIVLASPGVAESVSGAGQAPSPAGRVALLIGNRDYAPEVGLLKNPLRDIELVERALVAAGFGADGIRSVRNAGRLELLAAVDDFAERLAAAGDGAVGFFYYSGHGASDSVDGRNYLIPQDVERLDRDVWHRSVALSQIVDRLQRAAPRAAQFVVFDACRNVLNTGTRGGTKGFLPVPAQRGMMIAFSAEPGQTASDGEGDGGPYARALAAELLRAGQDHLDLFQNVKERVYRATGNQVPWERNGLLTRVYLNSDGAGADTTGTTIALPAPITVPGGNDDRVSPDTVRSVQETLTALDYEVGGVDGVLGGRTIAAIKSFQRTLGMRESGRITIELLGALNRALKDSRATAMAREASNAPAKQAKPASAAPAKAKETCFRFAGQYICEPAR